VEKLEKKRQGTKGAQKRVEKGGKQGWRKKK